MKEKAEKKILAILRVLQESDKPVTSSVITDQLKSMGHDISERTVRLYLLSMDDDGLTVNHGKKGRQLTEKGVKELSTARVIEKVGYLAAKIDQLTYRMNFNLATKTGTLVVNISVIEIKQMKISLPLFNKVFECGYSMGTLVTLFPAGSRVGGLYIPDGYVGIGTVCSVTINGVLLSHGIPTYSRFGGLLELQNGKPLRFAELIHYEGTTIDPLEIFIRSGLTDYLTAIKNGNGRVGASFRELPADSREKVIDLSEKMERVGLRGFLMVGWPGQPLLEIPVSEGRVGGVIMGGLNPVAVLEENGIRVQSRALASLVDFQTLFPYTELKSRLMHLS